MKRADRRPKRLPNRRGRILFCCCSTLLLYHLGKILSTDNALSRPLSPRNRPGLSHALLRALCAVSGSLFSPSSGENAERPSPRPLLPQCGEGDGGGGPYKARGRTIPAPLGTRCCSCWLEVLTLLEHRSAGAIRPGRRIRLAVRLRAGNDYRRRRYYEQDQDPRDTQQPG